MTLFEKWLCGLHLIWENSKRSQAFVVRAGVGLSEMPNVKNWEAVKRMSLCEYEVSLVNSSNTCKS
ncbi:unnamed protein product [Brassica oleracea var. botrytis]|uniref:(rape) hypothetical protein n=1 Tax=Brassica napus TaxID=3708 RepID=A0A078H2T1_BRANA|nr:unnamed protein product [Brassica napus]CDY31822.1 BnaC09g13270D [Brassica napus]